jgi:hypothetical protein
MALIRKKNNDPVFGKFQLGKTKYDFCGRARDPTHGHLYQLAFDMDKMIQITAKRP